jgi:hypothetical protein
MGWPEVHARALASSLQNCGEVMQKLWHLLDVTDLYAKTLA